MKKTFWIALVLAVTVYGGRLAWRAHQDLVTLEVRNADLKQVVNQLRWQTWEPIYVGEGVTGRVTLRVKDQSLETVLNIINEQINGRWSAVYPLYTSRRSLAVARALARGEVAAPVAGWTNWNGRMSPGGGDPRGPIPAGPAAGETGEGTFRMAGLSGRGFGGPEMASTRSTRVTVSFTNLPPRQVAASLRRQTGARVVPEDGTALPVTLSLTDVRVDQAVAAVAKKTFRKWTRFYVFEARMGGPSVRPPEVAAGESTPERPAGPSVEQREQMRQQMAADPARQEQAINRMISGLLNSTPQQRAERDQMRLARQKSQALR